MAVIEHKTSFILKPEADAAHAIVLYGGKFHWEGDWFVKKNQIPNTLMQKAAIALPKHYTNDAADALNELHSEFSADKITSYSICGFSAGASGIYRHKDLKEWKVLGMIDPSAPSLQGFKDNIVDDKKDKIRCVYWVPNWGKDGYGGRVPAYAQHLRDMKVDMTEKEVEHAEMAAFFFKTYGKEWGA